MGHSSSWAARFAALARIHQEGLEQHFNRFVEAAERVRSGLRSMGFEMLVEGRYACPVVSAVRARPEFGVSELAGYLRDEHDIMIAGGLGPLTGRIFRVGHMGKATTQEYTDAFLLAVEEFLRKKGLTP